MEYREHVADFAQRTLSNLDYLQDHERQGVDGVFPVTQLYNSLLGLLVLPYERELDRLPSKTLVQLVAERNVSSRLRQLGSTRSG